MQAGRPSERTESTLSPRGGYAFPVRAGLIWTEEWRPHRPSGEGDLGKSLESNGKMSADR